MKIISILSLKGGVGKTTTAVNMAYQLGVKQGKRVLFKDNDKQGNGSKAFRRYNAFGVSAAARLLSGEWQQPSDIIQKTEYESIDIVSANMSLLSATWNLSVKEKGEQHKRYKRLVDMVSNEYDYMIIDNPPDIGLNVINALTVTDQVIVPIKIDEWALEGLEIITGQIAEAKRINSKIELLGVLLTVYRNNDSNIAGLEWLERKSGIKVIGKIRYSEKADESTFFKPVSEYSVRSAVAQDYKKFVIGYLGV